VFFKRNGEIGGYWLKILIVGTGYVGTTTGLVFCEMGHKVTGLDVDVQKLRSLQSGKLHFYEPGLEDLLKKHIQANNISFTKAMDKAVKENDVIFICVGTPEQEDGSADLRYVKNVAESIGRHMENYKVVVDKSTVPVGTAELVAVWIKDSQPSNIPFDVVSNPEFLREGSALMDALKPDRIVIGGSSERAFTIMRELFSSLSCPILETSHKSAEMIKYAANSFLALKISYINEMARLCDVLKIDIRDVAKGIGMDPRIGEKFLDAGIGYGGSCFPKDVKALLKTAEDHHRKLSILEATEQINQSQPLYFIEKIKERLGTLEGRTIAILGLSFKPETDDTRESPSFIVIEELLKSKVILHVHDPIVRVKDARLKQFDHIEEAIQTADAIVLCTDWKVYRDFPWQEVRERLYRPVIFDGRNQLAHMKNELTGYDYYGVGTNW
jgi:UDPglucose 6-dehydrogenase